MVLIVEALTPAFGQRLWEYIEVDGHEVGHRSDGHPCTHRYVSVCPPLPQDADKRHQPVLIVPKRGSVQYHATAVCGPGCDLSNTPKSLPAVPLPPFIFPATRTVHLRQRLV